ncbi:uncharacterized protein [Typha latifolia]|uniref:uncharacterized protein n=1 Tax=Typha latifolia TaxID=4733 RepID=UPI003C2C3094
MLWLCLGEAHVSYPNPPHLRGTPPPFPAVPKVSPLLPSRTSLRSNHLPSSRSAELSTVPRGPGQEPTSSFPTSSPPWRLRDLHHGETRRSPAWLGWRDYFPLREEGFFAEGFEAFHCPKELAEEHYKDLKEKSFFPKLIDYITSGPVVCMAWEGVGVVASARKLIGATNPLQAEPGTIRGDLAVQTGRNVVHGSDSPENGRREIALWFKEGEICEWVSAQAPWLRE